MEIFHDEEQQHTLLPGTFNNFTIKYKRVLSANIMIKSKTINVNVSTKNIDDYVRDDSTG